MSRLGVLAAFLFSLPWMLAGQEQKSGMVTDKPLRIEVAAQSDKETYRIIPCGTAGMILFYKSVEVTPENATRWYFSYYDRNLQKVWDRSAPILSFLNYREVAVAGDTLCFYFESDKKNKNNEVNFQILRLFLRTGSFVLNNGKSPESGTMSSFSVVGQQAFIGCNNDARQPYLMMLDLPTGKSTIIPFSPGEPATLMNLMVDPHTGTMTVILDKEVSKKTHELFFCTYLPNGKKSLESRIHLSNAYRNVTHVTDLSVSERETLLAGIYSAVSSAKKAKALESTGLFMTSFTSAVQGSINFYNFLDLKNIDQILSEQDILTLRKKSMKRSRSEQEYSLDFFVLLHDILPWNQQYIAAAETYYPQYHTESFTDYDFYGRPYTNTYSVFDGYRFSGIILAGFDREGKLIWDNAMDLRNVLSFDLTPKVTLYPSEDELILTYLAEGKIACRIIREGQTLEKTSWSELELMSVNDKLLSESRSDMVHWYENFFLCCGYQEIRDISKGGNDKRLVFFCNKVRFDR